ncbi:unannotated protein [freshwater metagenome]|uniref:Unannotated protein n=1 Tax=freshwater metagenome TaxID=449393 RepID=A0A6J7AK37_9ZZZZ
MPEAPDAIKRTVSLVEVHPSESKRLYVLSATLENISCKLAGSITASVITTESMVASAGANIPAPLAIPVVVVPDTVDVAIFGTESVVMIARAAISKFSDDISL